MNEFDILTSAAAGMDAERAALDLAARNVAAAEATPGKAAFERLIPRFETTSLPSDDAGDGPSPGDLGATGDEIPDSDLASPIRYVGATREHGVDVDAMTEMVSVLGAQRAYEANASVFDLGKRLAERTLDLGRLS